jgi:nitrate reductase NapE component
MRKWLICCVLLVIALPFSASAQDAPAETPEASSGEMMMGTPSVSVVDQVILNSTVRVNSAYSEGPGFVVIHVDNGEGNPGPVIGYRWLSPGMNWNIDIPIDAAQATPVMFAMLHVDTGVVGAYEFLVVPDTDGPVAVDGQVVTPAFGAEVINSWDQFVNGDTVTIASVTTGASGWLVIHSDNGGAPGPVLGQTQVAAGTTPDVAVTLAAEGRTTHLWPMLHVDTGVAGTYEFGSVDGADVPVIIDGKVATVSFSTAPNARVWDQIVIHGDNVPNMEGMEAMTPTVVAQSVLSQGPGFLVIHTDNAGAPGPVAGWAAVPDGLSTNVEIALDQEVALTPVLWPMLHVDTGAVGTYEFLVVPDTDGPVAVDGSVITFPISAAPAMEYAPEQTAENNVLAFDSVVIDAPGWLVIHSSADGAPGPVLTQVPLLTGLNTNVWVTLPDLAAAGAQVFPMLHYDTGAPGAYEFGSVDGADLPVRVGEQVVVSPLAIAQ